MSSATPADVLTRRRHLLLIGDADGFAELFAPDPRVLEDLTDVSGGAPCQ